MAKHVFVVFTSAVEGRDEEFNEWYDNTHIHDVLKVPGYVAAQRFKVVSELSSGIAPKCKYIALYEMETDDPAKTLSELVSRAGTAELANSEAMDLNEFGGMIAAAIGPREVKR
jgi:hypothetical protein